MGQLLTGLSQGRPGLLGWPGFYLLLAAAYAVITLAVLAKLVRRARRPGAAPADNRWLGWLLLLGLAHGLVYSVANPPWFAPDEPSHFEYARLMAGLGRVPTEADISDGLQGEIIGSMYTLDFWRLNRMETPATPPVAFGRGLTGDKRGIPRTFVVNDRFIWYTVQIGNEPSLYYAFVQPAFWPVWGGSDILEQFYRVRWLTLLLYLACVAITFVTARRFMPHLPGGAVGATALVIFHPMLAYIGTSVNNDVAGAALGAAWFGVAAVILLGGWRWRWGLGFVSLTLLAALTKKTTMFLYPLFVVALGLYYLHRRRARLALLGGAATALGAAVVVGALALSNSPGQAVLWVARPDPRLEARSGGQAFEGEHAFRLQAAPSTQELRLNQPLTRQTLNALRGKTVTLQAAVRGGGAEQRGRLGLIDEAGRHTTAFVVGDDWQTVRFEYSVPANTQYLRVALLPGDGSE
ncbi:MAG: hypothetical protein ACE5G8_17950, partial [Anaerolineae bacterium]